MKNRVFRPLVGAGLMVALATVLSGCGSCKPGKPGPIGRYGIEVVLDESLKTGSVIVDLVGVNPSTLARWEAYDMSKYWKEGDTMRSDADKVPLNFVSGQSLTNSLPMKDAQWDKWKGKGVSHIVVVADLPGPVSKEARRLVLPLDECTWPPNTKVLKVLVQPSGMQELTPRRLTK